MGLPLIGRRRGESDAQTCPLALKQRTPFGDFPYEEVFQFYGYEEPTTVLCCQ